MAASPPAVPGAAAPATVPWQTALADEFEACALALKDQITSPTVGAALAGLLDQQQQYRLAASDLRTQAIDGLLAVAPDITAMLQQATTDAKAAAERIARLAAAVGLVASLLTLAIAIAASASTGNPGSLLSAAQGVIAAAGKV